MQLLSSFCSATKLALVFGAALSTISATRADPGTLGRRFAEFSFDAVDFSGTSDRGYSSALSLNLPVTASLDLGASYAYGWLNTTGSALREHTLTATAILHANGPGPKPFLGVGFGVDWTRRSYGWFRVHDADAVWGAGAGIEVPLGEATSLTPSITFADTMRPRSIGAVNYAVELNHWFTRGLAGFGNVTCRDYTGDHGHSWVYRVGLRFSF